jgi:N-acetylglucosaminyldiphosphoundecaprenol N-acetyl-beta-D-mannosaminyltransferase
MPPLSTSNILNYSVSTLSEIDTIHYIENHIDNYKTPIWLACLNPHSYVTALDDFEFSAALHNANIIIPDGIGIVIADRFLNHLVKTRITGPDIFFGLSASMQKRGNGKVFFLGSTQECLDDIRVKFGKDYPNIEFSGCWSPPFKEKWTDLDNTNMRNAINQANPDVLWVGMTAPKQEKWIYENLPDLNIRFAAGIGAVFDFYTGRVKRSPIIFQKIGLDWLLRLIQQPRRLWRRTFLSAPIFIVHAFLSFFNSKRP